MVNDKNQTIADSHNIITSGDYIDNLAIPMTIVESNCLDVMQMNKQLWADQNAWSTAPSWLFIKL